MAHSQHSSSNHSRRYWTTTLNQEIILFSLLVGQYLVTVVIRDRKIGAKSYGGFIRKEILRKIPCQSTKFL
jgi:hypothetical protein